MSWFLPFDSTVKIEHDDPESPFIIELPVYPPPQSDPDPDPTPSAPPTEVPLRATQASKEMRRMMGVFRLNPFAMHSLSRGPDSDDSPDASPTGSISWCAEPGPLDQEPVMFEFQLDISDPHPSEQQSRIPAISAHDESQLRSFSPSFELHEGDLSEPPSDNNSYIHHVNHHHQLVASDKDPGSDFRHRQRDSWEDADYAPNAGSDSGASSSTTSLSVQTPLTAATTDSAEQTSPAIEFSSTSLWDVPDEYQIQEDGPASGSSPNYAHADPSHRAGILHPDTYMRLNYPPPYDRHPYPQQNTQFQHHPNFFVPTVPTIHSPSLLHNSRRPSVHESSPSQDMEPVPQSPSTLSPLSPETPNSLQYAFNQQQHYQSQQHPSPSHQIPVYNTSSPVTPTSMPLLLPISVARSAMRSAVAYSNAASPTNCHSGQHLYNMQSSGRGYRVSRGPHLEERISEHEVYSTPHSPVTNEEHRERYVPSLSMAMPISVLHRSSTYAGSHPVPGPSVVSSGHPNMNNRRWSLPEMTTVGAHTAVGHTESFLGHVLGS